MHARMGMVGGGSGRHRWEVRHAQVGGVQAWVDMVGRWAGGCAQVGGYASAGGHVCMRMHVWVGVHGCVCERTGMVGGRHAQAGGHARAVGRACVWHKGGGAGVLVGVRTCGKCRYLPGLTEP